MARILPEPTPETRHFWDGCRDGELRLQRCTDCNHTYFPPRAFCPSCASRKVEVYAASGRGVLWSYVINHRPRQDMGTEPYAIAVVKLDARRPCTNSFHLASKASTICWPVAPNARPKASRLGTPALRC